jgi:hypothetical protein
MGVDVRVAEWFLTEATMPRTSVSKVFNDCLTLRFS